MFCPGRMGRSFWGSPPHDPAGHGRQAGSVPGDPCLRLILEVVPAAEPVRGVVRAVDGEWEVGFRGWLELAAALETALRRGASGPGKDPLG